MNIDRHVSSVRDQLEAAASLGDDRTREIARTLAITAQSAVRLAVLDALTEAAAEANAALFEAAGPQAAPAISFHADGDSVRASVSTPPQAEESEPRADEGETTARISLRLSESLKADIDQAAARAEVSVNTWIIRAAAAALRSDQRDSWSNWGSVWGGWPGGRTSGRTTGWVTG